METILEQQRRYHEERERLVKLMVDEYVQKKGSVSMRQLYLTYTFNFHHCFYYRNERKSIRNIDSNTCLR